MLQQFIYKLQSFIAFFFSFTASKRLQFYNKTKFLIKFWNIYSELML